MSVWYFEYELLENYFSKNTIYIIHYMTVFMYMFSIWVSMNLVNIITMGDTASYYGQ